MAGPAACLGSSVCCRQGSHQLGCSIEEPLALWLLQRALVPPAPLANEGGIIGPDVARRSSSARYMESPESVVDVESAILQGSREPRQLANEPSTKAAKLAECCKKRRAGSSRVRR